MTRDETKKLFALMIMAYPPQLRIENTEHTITLWFKLLEDINYKDAERGMINIIKTSKYPPSIADVRNASEGAKIEKLFMTESQLAIEAALQDIKMLESENESETNKGDHK